MTAPRAFFLPALAGFVLIMAEAAVAETAAAADPLAWPVPTQVNRPWTRWWWLGSAVDETNLRRELGAFRDAGIGGVEICPIYGAKGYESRFIPYLSTRWMEVFAAAAADTADLGLGLDLTTGTGWPMGGPWITPEFASSAVVLRRFTLAGGERLKESLPAGEVRSVVAAGSDGRQIDLTQRIRQGNLDWAAPAGSWRVYALLQRQPIQKVKRAAPGDEGYVVDPYSTAAMDHFLARFDRAFHGYAGAPPRAEFHDSFEYFGASWSNDFFAEFARRRGYDLRTQVPAFFGDGDEETVARVRYDYRATIGELHQAFIGRWTEWSHAHGSLTREQAHGSPTNLEDVYATADIPETEGRFGGAYEAQMPMLQFASSAAHVTGRTLASSETFTWLGEHFRVTLAQLKPVADFFFLAGINHIFFHGIPYSPADAPWPGWLFYASVNLGPNGGIWHDLPAFNAYATRCQSLLQSGHPANDLLLYFPVADYWQIPGERVPALSWQDLSPFSGVIPPGAGDQGEEGPVQLFTTPGTWMEGTPFHTLAMELERRGFSYDEVTDRFIAETTVEGGRLKLGGNFYRAIVLPRCRFIPVATLGRLVALARAGATIIVQDSLPSDVPGLGKLSDRRRQLSELLAVVKRSTAGAPAGNWQARIGQGWFLMGSGLPTLLSQAGVDREAMRDLGLRSIRRRDAAGTTYFIVNSSEKTVDGWVPLAIGGESAVTMDPRFENLTGVAALRRDASGCAQVYLQIGPGESRFVRLFHGTIHGPAWPYVSAASASPQVIAGPWKVRFLQGGPALPKAYESSTLASWTAQGDFEAKRFAGTGRYRVVFDFHPTRAKEWWLDLGRVCESARIHLNGFYAGTLWCAPFRVPVGNFLQPGRNVLEIDVTNLAANRIADLDRRQVTWQIFYEINFVNLEPGYTDYRPFDASHWTLRDSGLLGPVTLTPVNQLQPSLSFVK